MNTARETTELVPKSVTSFRNSYVYKRVLLILVTSLYSVGYEMSKPLTSQFLYNRISYNYNLLSETNSSTHSKTPCQNASGNTSAYDKQQDQAQDQSSRWLLYLGVANGISATFACVVFGAYTDVFGRKFLFILSSLGTCFRGICYLVVVYWSLPLPYLIIGYAVEGASGYYYAFSLAAYAFSSDVTPPESSRTLLIIVVDLGKYFAKAAAELCTGVLINYSGFLYPGFLLTGSMILNIIIVAALLPETRPRNKIQNRKGFCEQMQTVSGFVTRKENGSNAPRGCYILGVTAFLVYCTGILGEDATEKLYFMDNPLCWNSLQIGYYDALRRICSPVGTLTTVWLLQRVWRDESIIQVVGTSAMAYRIVLAFAKTDTLMYLSIAIGALDMGFGAMMRAILSKNTDPDSQGALFAGLQMVESFVSIVGAVSFNLIYQMTLSSMKGAVFLYASGMTLIAIVLLWIMKMKYFRHGPRVLNLEKTIN